MRLNVELMSLLKLLPVLLEFNEADCVDDEMDVDVAVGWQLVCLLDAMSNS